jgi:hypothetical protein
MSSAIAAAIIDPATTLCFPDITGATIGAYFNVTFSPGTYVTGGVPMGLIAWADSQTVDFHGFLECTVTNESYDPPGAVYTFRYVPTTDTLVIFLNGVELASGASVTITDSIIAHGVWNRTTTLG